MIITSAEGNDIFVLPECGVCIETITNPMRMDHCPLCKFDDDGDICVPELCEAYIECPFKCSYLPVKEGEAES